MERSHGGIEKREDDWRPEWCRHRQGEEEYNVHVVALMVCLLGRSNHGLQEVVGSPS